MKQKMRVVSAVIALLCGGVVPAAQAGFTNVASVESSGIVNATEFFTQDEPIRSMFLNETDEEDSERNHDGSKKHFKKKHWVAYVQDAEGSNDGDGLDNNHVFIGRFHHGDEDEAPRFVLYASAFYATNGTPFALDVVQVDYEDSRKDEVFVVVGGRNDGTENTLRIYRFNRDLRTLTPTFAEANFNEGTIFWVDVKKIDHKYYVFAAGNSNNDDQEVRVYQFDPSGGCSLTEVASQSFSHQEARSIAVKRIGGVIYVAAVGYQDTSTPNAIKIYTFDPTTNTLSPFIIQGVSNDQLWSVAWLKLTGSWYLAVGTDNTSATSTQLKIYLFNPMLGTLTPTTTTSFGTGTIYAIESGRLACNGKIIYVCGDDGQSETAELRAYIFTGVSLVPAGSYPALDPSGEIYGVDAKTIDDTFYVSIGNNGKTPDVTQFQILKFIPTCTGLVG